MGDTKPGEFQRSKQTAAEETAGRLADKAERLLRQSMRPTNLTVGKHKWATGKEKWEALQSDGAKAAGKKRGRPKKPEPTPAELLAAFIDRVLLYQEWVSSGTQSEFTLQGERECLLKQQLELAT